MLHTTLPFLFQEAMSTQAAKMLALQKPTGLRASCRKALPKAVALPADCSAGDLLEVLEFVQVCILVSVCMHSCLEAASCIDKMHAVACLTCQASIPNLVV